MQRLENKMSQWPTNLTVKPIIDWPGKMTRTRQRSNFSSTHSATLSLLATEMKMINAKDPILQVAIPRGKFRIDGRPYADARPEHPGVILTFSTKHGALSYPCDRFNHWQDNLRAIALSLEALRKVDRYGVTKSGEQYKGFLAIEAPTGSEFVSEAAALGWLEDFTGSSGDPHVLLRRAQRIAHPDMGGRPEDWEKLQKAKEKLRVD